MHKFEFVITQKKNSFVNTQKRHLRNSLSKINLSNFSNLVKMVVLKVVKTSTEKLSKKSENMTKEELKEKTNPNFHFRRIFSNMIFQKQITASILLLMMMKWSFFDIYQIVMKKFVPHKKLKRWDYKLTTTERFCFDSTTQTLSRIIQNTFTG